MIIWRAPFEGLRQIFKYDVTELLASSPYTWYVLSALRTNEVQDALYAAFLKGGPRAAPAGKSAHNFGLAIDVVPDIDAVTTGLQPDWDHDRPEWLWLAQAVDAHPRLHHGRAFGDWPHIEATHWQFVSKTVDAGVPV